MRKGKQQHKYLNDLGIKSTNVCIFNSGDKDESGRQRLFRLQRKKYGFDERETWSMDFTLITWLYSHLKMFLEIGGKIVDLEFQKFSDVPVLVDIPEAEREYYSDTMRDKGWAEHYQKEVLAASELSLKQCIDIAIKYMEQYLVSGEGEYEEERRGFECAQCALKIIAIIFPALWW